MKKTILLLFTMLLINENIIDEIMFGDDAQVGSEFYDIDTNKDGLISLNEQLIYSIKQHEEVFDYFDKNKNTFVEIDEYVDPYDFEKDWHYKNQKAQFDKYDTNKDSRFTKKEYLDALHSRFVEDFEKVDKNKSGFISKKEYADFYRIVPF